MKRNDREEGGRIRRKGGVKRKDREGGENKEEGGVKRKDGEERGEK